MSNGERGQHRVVFGVLIILAGVLALLDNLQLFSARQVFGFLPLILVVFGVMKVYRARDAGDYAIGGALIVAGVAITLRNMGIITLRWRDWWPVLLIAGGALIIVTGVFRRKAGSSAVAVEVQSAGDSRVNVAALMSGIAMSNATQDFRGGNVSAICGGVELDLRKASIEETATLRLFALMGGIEIKVPDDWSVVSNCVPILGGVDDKSVPPANPVKRLVITGGVIMGGVEIKN